MVHAMTECMREVMMFRDQNMQNDGINFRLKLEKGSDSDSE